MNYEEKNKEQQISEKQYRTIVENSYDLIYEVDSEGKILYVSPPCKALIGFEQSELIGKSAFDFIHPDDLSYILSVFRKAITNMSTEKATYRARDKSGRYRWFECTGNPYLAANGEIRGVIITRDITDRKAAEEALASSEALFRAIFERAAIGIALVGMDGRPITINPALQNMLGYSVDEIREMVFTEFTHPEDAAKDWELFQQLVSGEISHYQLEKRYYCKNGELLNGWLNVSLVKGAQDKSPFIVATVDNITERKTAEQELIALNILMDAVHKSLDLEEVYNVALDTIMKLENIDMAMIYLVEEEKKEAILQAHRNLPETYLQRASSIPYPKGTTWKVINSGSMINIEDAQKDPDIGPAGKDLGHHGILGIPIFLKNKTIGVIWFLGYKERTFSDREVRLLSALGDQIALAIAKAKMIQEIKFTQAQLVQSEKLASIGQLISSIAHEINNPLTPIMGYSERLLKRSDIDQKNKDSLEIIHSSAERVFKIIDKLLSFSRKYVPIRRPEDINSLVEQSLEFREYQLKLANIEVVKDFDLSLPKTMVDPNQIQQVFTNIILNAEQAIVESQSRGRLEVKTSANNSTGAVEISFTDDGPGIPPDVVGKVFDPFFTTKEPGKGTGLGLSVAYGIIKEHGGEIRIESNSIESDKAKGTSFIITLPMMEQQNSPPNYEEKTINGSNKLKKKRVLIVEDEKMVSELIKAIIERENIVDVASNGREGLEKIDSIQYDLIICDIKMPELSGTKFYDEVKNKYPELTSRIIFITGDPSQETMKFLTHAGIPFIVKPFKVDVFRAYVNKIFA